MRGKSEANIWKLILPDAIVKLIFDQLEFAQVKRRQLPWNVHFSNP